MYFFCADMQVINMQETTKQMVNHIRIMVEEAEASSTETQVCKSVHVGVILPVISQTSTVSLKILAVQLFGDFASKQVKLSWQWRWSVMIS